MKAGRRIFLALALSLILFLPISYAASTITLTSPKAETGGNFGFSVAVNEGDSIVVVGARDEAAGIAAPQAGHAYVLDTATGFIIPVTTDNPQTGGGEFGRSVAVSGTTVVVGAPLEKVDTALMAGHAYVFDATTGTLTHTLKSPAPQAGGHFGWSVSVSRTTAVVGAPDDTTGGHPYAFAVSPSLPTSPPPTP